MTLEQALSQIKGPDPQAEQGALDRWASVAKPLGSLGLLEENGDRLRLTDRGIDVSNYVMADFLLA